MENYRHSLVFVIIQIFCISRHIYHINRFYSQVYLFSHLSLEAIAH